MTRVDGKVVFGFVGSALVALCFQVAGRADDAPADIAGKQNPVASSDAVLAKAKSLYDENCLMCHGESGKGDGPMAGMLKDRPSDLTDAKHIGAMSDGQIFWVVTKGVKPTMPGFETKLQEEERWGLVHMMRSLSKTKSSTTPQKR